MKIGIDARFVGPQGTGLGKYTEKLILNLAKIDKNNQYFIFLKEDNWSYLKLNRHENFTKVLADVSWYSFAEQLKMPAIFAAQNLDLLHIPHFNVPIFYKGKFVVTIHDLIHHKFSEYAATTKNPLVFKLKRLGYKKVIENAVYKSQKIITPSNFVKNDILKNFKIQSPKIIVTYEAAEEEYFPPSRHSERSEESFKKYDIKNSFLLYVGNAYPHKNLNGLLDAMKIINNNSYSSSDPALCGGRGSREVSTENSNLKGKFSTLRQPPSKAGQSRTIMKLIIVCPRDVFSDRLKVEIQKRALGESVELKGYLPPKQLSKLFQKASAYVLPSLSEGFGIPGLNAMASGLPVICSDIPTLKEVYADAAIYFNPNDPEDVADKIRLLSRFTLDQRLNLIEKGYRQLKKYSWRKMAQETLEVYKEVTGG